MVKVLEKFDCELIYNTKQTCCGQPAYNAGYEHEAKVVGHKFLNDFQDDTYIVSPSGSCTGYVRSSFHKMFENSADHNLCNQVQKNMYEFTEFLVDVLGVTDTGAALSAKATYHDACGALRDCGIKEGPRRLLRNVRGLEMVEMKESETCCGFGGTFSVKYEPISIGMAQSKVKNALDTGAEYIISTDMSCIMHIEGYIIKNQIPLKAVHIADVLANF